MSLSDEITQELKNKGAAIVGFADLTPLPENVRHGYINGVSIVIRLNPIVINSVKDGLTMRHYEEYIKENEFLDSLALFAKAYLADKGYDSFALTGDNQITDQVTRSTPLPLKTVATRAGLGWIGKNAIFITEEYGMAVRLTAVLTNAPLETGVPVTTSRCGGCTVCKTICPAKAVSGLNWQVDKKREEFFDAFACSRASHERSVKAGILEEDLCCLCICSCPRSKKYLSSGAI
jgi:epoxyqueuosine reductase QueG